MEFPNFAVRLKVDFCIPLLQYQIVANLFPDTYTGCAWYDGDYCTRSCPSDKILVTQRSEIDDNLYEGDYVECLEGYVKLCCDPPSSTSDWPVDPNDIFEYPDEDNVSWYYNVEETSNDDGQYLFCKDITCSMLTCVLNSYRQR